MLKVEVYSAHSLNQQLSGNKHDKLTPDHTLHISLLTILQDNYNENGLVLSVGRKNCTVTYQADKSVSRNHASVRLIVNPELLPCTPILVDGQIVLTEDQIKSLAEWWTPQNDEEISQLGQNPCMLAFEDLGSKFGTFLLEQGSKLVSRQAAQPNEESDVTTDDEQPPPSMAIAQPVLLSTSSTALSPQAQSSAEFLTRLFFLQEPTDEPVLYKQTQLKPNKPLYLLPTTTTRDYTLIQFGVYGSCLKISHLPLHMCPSGLNKSELAPLEQLLSLGIAPSSLYSTWSNSFCTHLITNEVRPTCKALCAWLMQKPIVSPSFLKALFVDRKTAADALPETQNFCPPRAPNAELLLENPAADRTLLFKDFVVIGLYSKDHADILELCQAMGALIEAAYDKYDEILNHLESWILNLQKLRPYVLVLDIDPRRRPPKQAKPILKHLQELVHVQLVASTSIAEYVVQVSSQLKDVNGITIPYSLGSAYPNASTMSTTENSAGYTANKKKSTVADATPSIKQEILDDVHDQSPTHESNKDPRSKSRLPTKTFQVQPDVSKRINLPRAKNGWLVAAPTDNRKAYRCHPEDIVYEPAATEHVENLVVRSKSSRPKASSSGPNFKRFRKNPVLQRHYSSTSICFTTVLPKETERQRQMQLTQREMAEQEKAADALFQ